MIKRYVEQEKGVIDGLNYFECTCNKQRRYQASDPIISDKPNVFLNITSV